MGTNEPPAELQQCDTPRVLYDSPVNARHDSFSAACTALAVPAA
jgi:hypothetical protein